MKALTVTTDLTDRLLLAQVAGASCHVTCSATTKISKESDLKPLPNIERCREKTQRKLQRFAILQLPDTRPVDQEFANPEPGLRLTPTAAYSQHWIAGLLVFLCLLALAAGLNFGALRQTVGTLLHSFNEHLPLAQLLVIAAVFTLSGFVKGVSGIGMALIAVPVVSLIYSPALAIILVSVPLVVTNFHQGVIAADIRQTWQSHSIFTVVMTLVMATTAFFSYLISPAWVELTIGLSAIVFVLCNLNFNVPTIPAQYDRLAQLVTACIAGFVGGITGLIAIPLVCYMMLRNIQKDKFISVSGLLFLMSGIALLIGYFLNDILTLELLILSAMAAAPAMIGTLIGEHVRRHVSQGLFRKLVLFLIFAIGIKTLIL